MPLPGKALRSSCFRALPLPGKALRSSRLRALPLPGKVSVAVKNSFRRKNSVHECALFPEATPVQLGMTQSSSRRSEAHESCILELTFLGLRCLKSELARTQLIAHVLDNRPIRSRLLLSHRDDVLPAIVDPRLAVTAAVFGVREAHFRRVLYDVRFKTKQLDLSVISNARHATFQ